MQDQNIQITGTIEKIIFHNEENGFSVFKVLQPDQEIVTVVGSSPFIQISCEISCHGKWVQDRQHGMQLRAEIIEVAMPSTASGIERFLSSGRVKGIGQAFAKQLVAAFGDQTIEVIENEPGRILDLPGIGEKRLAILQKAWSEHHEIRDIMIFLHSYNISEQLASKIYNTYGNETRKLITTDPYRLCRDIHGIGFKTADQIALQVGISQDHKLRVEAGIKHSLTMATGQGHCYLGKEELTSQTGNILNLTSATITPILDKMLNSQDLVFDPACNGIYQRKIYIAERHSAKIITELALTPAIWQSALQAKILQIAIENADIQLSPSQISALSNLINNKISILTGGPGVGKTTILKIYLEVLQKLGLKVALAAPTGKAAKRMSEATGTTAKTIHRLLDFDPSTRDFRYNRDNKLKYDVIIIDECSMLDINLFFSLLQAIPAQSGLLLVGDQDQLPAVGPGQVLADCIASGHVHKVLLTEIHRQAQTSQLILNAHRINRGELPLHYFKDDKLSDFYCIYCESDEDIHNNIMKLVTERIPKRFNLSPIHDIQLLTPMQKGTLGARELNKHLQANLNPTKTTTINSPFGQKFHCGDRVMQRVNNYDKDVFNGATGIIVDYHPEFSTTIVEFGNQQVEYAKEDLDELVLAYAISIHKSQGSEFPAVIIPIANQHFMLLQRNLIYTAITRARKLAILICQKQAIHMAIRAENKLKRNTGLAATIRNHFLTDS